MFAPLQHKLMGKLFEPMCGEIEIIGRHIQSLRCIVVQTDVLEHHRSLARTTSSQDGYQTTVPVYLLMFITDITRIYSADQLTGCRK